MKTPSKALKTTMTPKSSGRSKASSKLSSKKYEKNKSVTTEKPSSTRKENSSHADLVAKYRVLLKDQKKEYYSSVNLLTQQEKFVDYPTYNFVPSAHCGQWNQPADGETITWRVEIGDYVCMEVPDFDDSKSSNNPPEKEYPFSVNWRPCQILSIFRTWGESKKWGPWEVEVRWLYNFSDLDKRIQSYENMRAQVEQSKLTQKKKKKKKKKTSKGWPHGGQVISEKNEDLGEEDLEEPEEFDEVFESEHVEILDLNSLLGRLILVGQKGKLPDRLGEIIGSIHRVVPTVVNFCNRFYLYKEKDLVHLYSRNMLERGLQCSKTLSKNASLKAKTFEYLNLSLNESIKKKPGNLRHAANVTEPVFKLYGRRAFYSSCILQPNWSKMRHSHLLCPSHLRTENVKLDTFPEWKICIGDVVAVQWEPDSVPPMGVDIIEGRGEWYPYVVPWSHAQVVAIYRDIQESTKKRNDCNGASDSSLVSFPASEVKCEIRWFYRLSEASAVTEKELKKQIVNKSNDDTRFIEEILESTDVSEISCDKLLGPVLIDCIESNLPTLPASECCNSQSRFLIQNRRLCNYNLCNKSLREIGSNDHVDRLQRGIEKSGQKFNEARIGKLLEAAKASITERAKEMEEVDQKWETNFVVAERNNSSDDQTTSCQESPKGFENRKKRSYFEEMLGYSANELSGNQSMPQGDELENVVATSERHQSKKQRTKSLKETIPEEEDTIQTRVTCVGAPFYVDVSAKKSFYDEIDVTPDFEAFANLKCAAGKGNWNVKLGDTVIVHFEEDFRSKPKKNYESNFPFHVNWAPAEIVTIFKSHKSKEHCFKLREHFMGEKGTKTPSSTDAEILDGILDVGETMVEVRWFYRKHEIPGESKALSSYTDLNFLDEVFETDHLQTVSADSLLSPMRLHEDKQLDGLPNIISGMPLIHYHCDRYWSIHRKSFVPRSSLSNRVERGRLFSHYLKNDGPIVAALEKRLNKTALTVAQSSCMTWRDAFRHAINKLELTECSQDVQVHGMKLTCREKERIRIADFLRKSISGLAQLNDQQFVRDGSGVKTSLFLAGAPGTGKTSCVKSVVRELEEEKACGTIPDFEFISLNAMEMRNPFEAYVKFWEAVSGSRKEKLTPGDACDALDNYFTSDNATIDDDNSNQPVTILLLDEFDLLKTKKNTIMYNFFDWPIRSAARTFGARLIVIGIANTINLLESLPQKVQSRIGGERLYFNAYNDEQIIAILRSRLGISEGKQKPNVFEPDAINFAARKISSNSGDIRQAFKVCSDAAKNVLNEFDKRGDKDIQPKVRIKDIQRSGKDMWSVTINTAISFVTSYHALVIIALGALRKDSIGNVNVFSVHDILTKIEGIASASGNSRYSDAHLSFDNVIHIVSIFADSEIIELTTSPDGSSPWPLVKITLEPYVILNSLKGTPHFTLAEKHLGSNLLW